MRYIPALRKKKALSGTYLAGQQHLALEPTRPKHAGRAVLTRAVHKHTNDAFLRNLLTIPRFWRLVNGMSLAIESFCLPVPSGPFHRFIWAVNPAF